MRITKIADVDAGRLSLLRSLALRYTWSAVLDAGLGVHALTILWRRAKEQE